MRKRAAHIAKGRGNATKTGKRRNTHTHTHTDVTTRRKLGTVSFCICSVSLRESVRHFLPLPFPFLMPTTTTTPKHFGKLKSPHFFYLCHYYPMPWFSKCLWQWLITVKFRIFCSTPNIHDVSAAGSTAVNYYYYYYRQHLLYAGYLYSYSWHKLCP